MIIKLLFSAFVVILAGRLTLSNRFFALDSNGHLMRLSLYYAAGAVTISFYMLLLSILGIRYGVLVISVPFLIYFICILPGLVRGSSGWIGRLSGIHLNFGKMSFDNAVFIAAFAVIAVTVISVFLNNFVLPAFRVDAMAVWMYKAKIFFVEKRIPMDIMVNKLFDYRADYPLLVPLNMTWVSICLNKWDDINSKIFFSFLYLASLVIFYFSIKGYSNRTVAMISTLVVFTVPTLLAHLENGYADFPLASLTLISVIFLFKWMNTNKNNHLFLSAFFIGGAAWTKNDGIGLCASALLTVGLYLVIKALKTDPAQRPALAARFLIYAAIAAVIFMPFKIVTMHYHVVNHMLSNENIAVVFFKNLDRIPVILNFFLYELYLNTYQWLYFWIYFTVLLLLHKKQLIGTNLAYLFLFVIVSLGLYTFIYTITALGYVSQLGSSADRILLSLTPSAGFLTFTAAFGQKETFR